MYLCAVGGFVRVYMTHGNFQDSVAIATSLLLIVLASVLLGTVLPFALVRAGIDPAHAGSSIQVCPPKHVSVGFLLQFVSSFQ